MTGALSTGTVTMLYRPLPRNLEPELMDEPGLDPTQHQRALDGLARLNRISLSTEIIWTSLRKIVCANPGRGWRILDLASGGGDIPTGIARRALAAGLPITVHGSDVSPFAVQHAQDRARRAGLSSHVEFFRLDALAGPLPDDYDIITCSLFLHHLTEKTAEDLLRRMATAARRGVLVNDLRRTRVGHALACIACRLVTRSRIVRVDGPLSSRAAFTIDEVSRLAERSGLEDARIQRRWPQRFLLQWTKPRSDLS